MVDIGSKYEETKSMLVEKLNDPNNIEVLLISNFSDGHACYFCLETIPNGDKMSELIYRHLNSLGKINEAKYPVHESCLKNIREEGL